MSVSELDKPFNELLDDIGAGKPTPGSGSAAAALALICSNLTKTVSIISSKKYTNNENVEFEKIVSQLNLINTDLKRLFITDSDEFEKVISYQKQRNKATEREIKLDIDHKASEQLVIATNVVIDIAKRAIEIATLSQFVFENGFKKARGDSGGAIIGSIGVLDSCLVIINLNLQYLSTQNIGISKIIEERELLRKESKLWRNEIEKIENYMIRLADENIMLNNIANRFKNIASKDPHSNEYIENLTRDIQNKLWLNQKLFLNKETTNPIEVLLPDNVLTKILKYKLSKHEEKEFHMYPEGTFEVAGVLDNSKSRVDIYKHDTPQSERFTIAHELGHAILHDMTELHRDRPIDANNKQPLNWIEKEANYFASNFLMPKKMVIEIFNQIFGASPMIITNQVIRNLGFKSDKEMNSKYKDKKSFCRFLAGITVYGGQSFNSLSSIFNVSIEMMAIRLEELNLIQYD